MLHLFWIQLKFLNQIKNTTKTAFKMNKWKLFFLLLFRADVPNWKDRCPFANTIFKATAAMAIIAISNIRKVNEFSQIETTFKFHLSSQYKVPLTIAQANQPLKTWTNINTSNTSHRGFNSSNRRVTSQQTIASNTSISKFSSNPNSNRMSITRNSPMSILCKLNQEPVLKWPGI